MTHPQRPDLADKDVTRFAVLPLEDMRVDPQFQRALNANKVKMIVANFDPKMLGPITVSQRGAKDYVILDGQHRWMALVELGYTLAKCEVVVGLSVSAESATFFVRNVNRTALLPGIKFRSRLVAMEPVAMQIDKLVRAAGFRIDFVGLSGAMWKQSNPDSIIATNTLERIHTWGILGPTLYVIRHAWVKDAAPSPGIVARADLMLGVAAFLRMWHEAQVDEAARKFSKFSADAVLMKAAGIALNDVGQAKWSAIALVLKRIYNAGRQIGKLPDRDLTSQVGTGWAQEGKRLGERPGRFKVGGGRTEPTKKK